MGRSAVHTQEQVFEAADKLVANGQEVTPNALRALLDRGSYSTFVKHIDAWQMARQVAPVPVMLDMPGSVKAAFAQCWQAAASEAGKEIAAIRDQAEADITAAKRRLDDAITAIEQLEGEAEVDGARFEIAEASLARERAAAQLAATEAAARTAALSATTDQMRQQIAAQQAEQARTHVADEATRRQHAAEITRLTADFSRQLAEAGEKLDATSARERAKIEEAAITKAEAARLADQLKDQKVRSVEVIGKLEQGKQTLAAELTAARKEVRELAAQLGRATGELDALRTPLAAQGDKKTK